MRALVVKARTRLEDPGFNHCSLSNIIKGVSGLTGACAFPRVWTSYKCRSLLFMGWSLLGACVEPTQEPGNSTLLWDLLGCGRSLLFMGGSLLGPCVEPAQEPGNSTLFWDLLGCGRSFLLMGRSLLEPCEEPAQQPGNSTLLWVLLGCGLGSRCVPVRGPSWHPGALI